MKKTISSIMTVTILLLVCLPVSAGWTWGDFSFCIAPGDPLFKESRSNPFSNTTAFHHLTAKEDTSLLPNTFMVADPTMNGGNGGYRELPFDTASPKHNDFWHMKVGINTGLMRFEWKDRIRSEIYLHGGLNTVFADWGGVNALGFDGMYGLGFSVSIYDIAVVRAGLHHFSGHWGDEMMKKFEMLNPGGIQDLIEYTRNNSWFFDVSIEPVRYFRLLAEAELPCASAWIRPSAHVPQNTETPKQGDVQHEHIAAQEGVRRTEAYPASYRGWRIGLGAEAELPVRGAGNLFVSYDLELHQDGKIDLGTLKYVDSRPWETEHTVAAGFEFEDGREDPSFTVEFSYHWGRFPLLNYFWQRTEYLGVGLSASF